MEKTKRLITLLLAVLCALALCVPAFAADVTVITDMKTDCLVDASGSCQITQTVTIDIAGTEDTIELPLAANAKKISVAGYKYKKTTQDGYTVLVLSSNGGFSGSRTFTILYTISGLVTEQDKIQTLTLPLLAPKWNWAINNYDFTISLPAAFESYPAFTSGYYGDVIEDYMSFTVREGMIGGTVTTALRDHESLSMTLTVGEGYFAGKYARWSSGWVETALVMVFSALALLYWALTLRSKRLSVSSRATPPDAALPCDLPYLLAGGVPDFNMLICHWAALGYLTIEMDEKGHVLLHRQVIMGNERKRLEVKIFASLFSRGDVCDGASLVYKTTAQNAMRAIRRYWDRRLYARSSGNVKIMQALCAIAASIASLAVMSQLLPNMPARGLILFAVYAGRDRPERSYFAHAALLLPRKYSGNDSLCRVRAGASDCGAAFRRRACDACRGRNELCVRASHAARRQAHRAWRAAHFPEPRLPQGTREAFRAPCGNAHKPRRAVFLQAAALCAGAAYGRGLCKTLWRHRAGTVRVVRHARSRGADRCGVL